MLATSSISAAAGSIVFPLHLPEPSDDGSGFRRSPMDVSSNWLPGHLYASGAPARETGLRRHYDGERCRWDGWMEADSDFVSNRFGELDGWRGPPAPRRHRVPSVSANHEKTGFIWVRLWVHPYT